MAEPTYQILSYDDLRGWSADDHQFALNVFLNTCQDMKDPSWLALCDVAAQGQEAKAFFERFFTPVLIDDGADALFTGYFEPELRGARTQGGPFQYPIYKTPPGLTAPWLTRQEIALSGALEGQGLEIAWIDDPVDVFFLQVQGSGRVRLPDGDVIRVGYAAANGREYSSIGLELIRRGIFEPHQVSADVIRSWVRANGDDGERLLWTNDSFVFFREVNEVPADRGPLGAMNRSVTTLRTIAVDPAFVPLGAPVWIEKDGAQPMQRLMVGQDTGSAIKGAQRADIFFGTGDEAGQQAGQIKDGGRMIVLMPIDIAEALKPVIIE